MKKITAIAAVVILTTVLYSCTRDPDVIPPCSVCPPPPPDPVVSKVNMVSEWLSLPLTAESNGASSWLQGKQILTTVVSYDPGTHKQFVFAKIPGRDSYVYKALPMQHPTLEGKIDFNFALDFYSFTIKIQNADFPARLSNPQLFDNYRYRYMVVSDDIYRAHNIDWTSYEAIVGALSSSIYFPQ